jgi:DNA-binding CsgD family transcriptional regulator
LLDQRDLLALRDGSLVGVTDSAAALRRCECDDGAFPMGFEAALSDRAGGEHLLFATWLRDLDEGTATVLLRPPREPTRNPIAVAARLCGLTQAQMQVAALLAQASGPQEISEMLGVSLATIRSHLGELFRRTGIRNQAEFVAWILAAASPFSAP